MDRIRNWINDKYNNNDVMKKIKIGRSSECDIIFTYDKISRVHAILSINEGQYIYHDLSKNGSNIGGRIIVNEKIVIAPGTTVLLANKVPLPWEQVYAILNPKGNRIDSSSTIVEDGHHYVSQNLHSHND